LRKSNQQQKDLKGNTHVAITEPSNTTMYLRPSRILPGDRIVTNIDTDAEVISWQGWGAGMFTARVRGSLEGSGLRIAAGPEVKSCCGLRLAAGVVVHDDGGCHGHSVPAAGAGPGGHPLSDSMDLPVYVRKVPLWLPPLTWLGEHPAAHVPEPSSGRLYRCIRCNARDGWSLRCLPGLTVHLPAQPPEPWTLDDLARAQEYWLANGYAVKPAPPLVVHPTYRVCAGCSTQDLLYRQLELPRMPLTLQPQK
jgi:hypothetical protein